MSEWASDCENSFRLLERDEWDRERNMKGRRGEKLKIGKSVFVIGFV